MKTSFVRFSTLLAALFFLAYAVPLPASEPSSDHHASHHTSDSALKELKDGNQRFVDNRPLYPNQDKTLRDRLSDSGQTPMAAILSCSDSRVPTELVFDLGFGDLFMIRVAGNVPGEDEMGSIEYAVDHLNVPLVVVMGHTKCGAVTAAVQEADEPGALGQLLARLKPAAQSVADVPADQKVPTAVKNNVDLGAQLLITQSPALARAVQEGRTKVIGAVYQLEDGRVIFD